jgi:hypothetical protein
VPISLSPLEQAVLLSVTEFEVVCPAGFSPTIRGDTLASAEDIGTEGQELTGFAGTLEGTSTGEPDISEYFNDGGTKITARLEVEAGSGFVKADENAEGQLGLTVLGSQMIVITNR